MHQMYPINNDNNYIVAMPAVLFTTNRNDIVPNKLKHKIAPFFAM